MARVRGVALLLLGALTVPVPSLAADPKGALDTAIEISVSGTTARDGFVPGELLLRFKSGTSKIRQQEALDILNGRVAATIENLRVHRVLVEDSSLALIAARQLGGIEFAELNRIGHITAELLPDDRCFGSGCGIGRLWNLDAINAPAGWAVYPGTFYSTATKAALPSPVKIAVLDTKLDLDRHDWRNVSPGSTGLPYDARFGGQIAVADAADFVTNKSHSGSAAYHGTFVAGLLGASANNTTDVAGVAYHAQIVPVAVVDGNGGVTAFDLAGGIDHATTVGARVINMSLGMFGPDNTVELAIARALQKQIVLVAAAGNNGNDQPFYPAWYSGVMAVTASTAADRPASCTNHSSKTSVAAPGAQLVGLDPRSNSGLSLVSCGTSTATPHVSGLAALLVSQNPGRSGNDIRRIIEETADDDSLRPGRDEYFGAGRINVERALRYAQPVPNVQRLSVSIPPNNGGNATAKATATATSSTTILEAELFVNRMGTPGTGIAMSAQDGGFDESEETLQVTLSTTLQQTSGAYRIFVRARSVNGWGPATAGALIVDKSAPMVTMDSSRPLIAIPELNVPASVVVRITDDFGVTAKVSYEIRSAVDDRVVTASVPVTAAFGDPTTVTWRPELGDAGLYYMTINVVDEAGNTGRASIEVLVT